MEIEKFRNDILYILYSIRNGRRYLSYKGLKDRLPTFDDPSLINELITLSSLKLIKIHNSLTRFLEGSEPIAVMSLTTQGEMYFKQFLEARACKPQLVANIT